MPTQAQLGLIKDFVSTAVPMPIEKMWGLADVVADYTTLLYDSEMGVDAEHENEHAMELAVDQQSLVSPEQLSKPIGVAKTAYDITKIDKPDDENDKHAAYAKWGAMLGAPLGLLGMAGGAALGGLIGANKEPKAGHVVDGQKLAGSATGIAAAGLDAANNVPFGPPKPTVQEQLYDKYLASHPYGHYAF